jgi:four helix bundle protein
MFRFEKLDVWHKSVQFADDVYALTRTFPQNERFGLTSQIRRSAVSVSSNIAEGCGRSSARDFAHFLEIAYASLMEVVSQLRISLRQSFIDEKNHNNLYRAAEELARMLSGLRTSLVGRTLPPRE